MAELSKDRQWEDAAVCEVVSRYDSRVRPLRIESLGNRGGFSGANIWRVVTEAGDFALRCWPSPGLPRARITGLHRLLEHLRGQGLQFVAVPLRANDGSTLTRTAGHDWQLEPWLPGLADFRVNSSRERLRTAMTALAQWHLAASRFVPEADSAEWFRSAATAPSPAVEERLAIFETVIGRMGPKRQMELIESRAAASKDIAMRDLSRRILAFFQRGLGRVVDPLRLFRGVAVRLQPCLRDVWHDHVLFVGDEVTGLIDPSACRVESVASDLARLIGSLVQDDRAAWDFALAEYQRHRPLTANELALVAVLDRSGMLLSGWTWLEWLYLERRRFPDAEAVTKRLTEIVARMERLVTDGESSLMDPG